MKLFETEIVSTHTKRIRTPFGVSMYLVEGNDKALLIDTGMGVGDLKGYVDSITSLPYEVLLTHGHCDHCGGAVQFEKVWLHPLDLELEKTHASLEHRIEDVFNAPWGAPKGITEADFLPQRKKPYLPLEYGMEFDLGGEVVKVLPLPGHTAGSIVPLIVKDRCAIFGDAAGEGTLLHLPESTSIEEYKEALEKIDPAAFDRVLRFHGSGESNHRILPDMIELCGMIMKGDDAMIDADRMGYSGRMGRPDKHPGYEGNLIYDPERIFRKDRQK